jgi:hypothetical protein
VTVDDLVLAEQQPGCAFPRDMDNGDEVPAQLKRVVLTWLCPTVAKLLQGPHRHPGILEVTSKDAVVHLPVDTFSVLGQAGYVKDRQWTAKAEAESDARHLSSIPVDPDPVDHKAWVKELHIVSGESTGYLLGKEVRRSYVHRLLVAAGCCSWLALTLNNVGAEHLLDGVDEVTFISKYAELNTVDGAAQASVWGRSLWQDVNAKLKELGRCTTLHAAQFDGLSDVVSATQLLALLQACTGGRCEWDTSRVQVCKTATGEWSTVTVDDLVRAEQQPGCSFPCGSEAGDDVSPQLKRVALEWLHPKVLELLKAPRINSDPATFRAFERTQAYPYHRLDVTYREPGTAWGGAVHAQGNINKHIKLTTHTVQDQLNRRTHGTFQQLHTTFLVEAPATQLAEWSFEGIVSPAASRWLLGRLVEVGLVHDLRVVPTHPLFADVLRSYARDGDAAILDNAGVHQFLKENHNERRARRSALGHAGAAAGHPADRPSSASVVAACDQRALPAVCGSAGASLSRHRRVAQRHPRLQRPADWRWPRLLALSAPGKRNGASHPLRGAAGVC